MPSIQARFFHNGMRIQNWFKRKQPLTLKAIDEKLHDSVKLLGVADEAQFEAVDVAGISAPSSSSGRSEWVTITQITHHPSRIILYLHGGGYCIGSPQTHRCITSRIAAACDACVLAIDYRLAPAHPYPAALEDTLAAYRWLLAEGFAPEQIVIAGDSAGGGLTAAALMALRDNDEPLPAGGVLLSPWLDLVMTGMSRYQNAHKDVVLSQAMLKLFAENYLQGADPHDPLVSPIFGDMAGLPPLCVQVGSAEILLDDAARFTHKCEQAGVPVDWQPWDDMVHNWQFGAKYMPEAQEAIERIGVFVRRFVG